MYQRRHARVLLAVLVLVTLVLVTIDFRSPGDGPLERLRGVATSVLVPVQDGLATVVRPVGNAIGSVGDIFALRGENQRLRSRLEQLEERRRSFEDLERENQRLRELLRMVERTGFDTVPARVVGLGSSNWEWTLTLAVGTNHGVERNMAVIDGDGLVGRVMQVTPNASRVLLAVDPNFSAAAQIARLGQQGLIDGQGSDLMRFRPLDPEATIEVGDEVVTSSYSNSVFPAGIPIGSVERVGDTTTLLTRDLFVRPYVDFGRLDVVLVVLHAPIEDLPPPPESADLPFVPPAPPAQQGDAGGVEPPDGGSEPPDDGEGA